MGSPALNTILPPQWPVTGDPRYNIDYINNWYAQAIPHLNTWASDFFNALRAMGFTVQMITTPETWYSCATCWAYEFNVVKDGFSYRAALQPVNAMQYSSDAYAQYIAQKWAEAKSQAAAAAQTPAAPPPASSTPASIPTQTSSTPVSSSAPVSSTQPAAPSTPASQSVVKSATVFAPSGYTVGSPWSIVVMGAPGKAVSVAAWQDGRSLGETTYGVTDANGRFEHSGRFSAETIGRWQEIWKVGGEPVGTVTFTVLPAAGPTDAPQTPTTNTAVPQTPTQVVSVGTPASPAAPGAPGMPGMTPHVVDMQGDPWYKRIPVWAWALAGAGALWMMRDRR